MKKPIKINAIRSETLSNRLCDMVERTEKYIKDVNNIHVYIADGNTKTGKLVPSISLRPVLDCGNCKLCSKLCYDIRKDCMYPEVRATRARNAAIWMKDPQRYFDEVSASCKFFVSFRWHIGGDIVNAEYFRGMVRVALENPKVKFLCFTKRFAIVNNYLDEGKIIPENLKMIFSGWVGLDMPNPYKLATTHPLFADGSTSAHDGAKLCTGNCSECLVQDQNCWVLKPGEEIVFAAH